MAEQPVMDSATETPVNLLHQSLRLECKRDRRTLNTLLNASQAQETASEESTKEVSDSETNIEDAFEDDELIDQIEDEQPSESSQELYKVVDGQEQEVTLMNL